MERGALRFVMLDVLRDGPKHGYEMIKYLEERTHGAYVPSPGTIYPTLQYLSDLGQVTSSQDADRRVYQLTDAGRAELETQAGRLAEFWARFEVSEGSAPYRHELDFLLDELSELGRTVWTRLQPAIDRGDAATVRAVRQAVERCRGEIRDIIASAGGPAASGAVDRGEEAGIEEEADDDGE